MTERHHVFGVKLSRDSLGQEMVKTDYLATYTTTKEVSIGRAKAECVKYGLKYDMIYARTPEDITPEERCIRSLALDEAYIEMVCSK